MSFGKYCISLPLCIRGALARDHTDNRRSSDPTAITAHHCHRAEHQSKRLTRCHRQGRPCLGPSLPKRLARLFAPIDSRSESGAAMSGSTWKRTPLANMTSASTVVTPEQYRSELVQPRLARNTWGESPLARTGRQRKPFVSSISLYSLLETTDAPPSPRHQHRSAPPCPASHAFAEPAPPSRHPVLPTDRN